MLKKKGPHGAELLGIGACCSDRLGGWTLASGAISVTGKSSRSKKLGAEQEGWRGAGKSIRNRKVEVCEQPQNKFSWSFEMEDRLVGNVYSQRLCSNDIDESRRNYVDEI